MTTLLPWRITDNNIGYINMRTLETGQVETAFKALYNTKGLILDLRNYPKSVLRELGKYLNTDKKAFATLTTPDLSFPGMMKHSKTTYTGRKQSDVYMGKVVVLMDERTQSMAEFTVMALETGRDVTTVGSQTAGADGDTRKIPLPGGFVATMTGIGVYYPDGRETQRIGIVPEIEVKPTISGIRAGTDEVFEAAKKFIMENGQSTPKKAAF